IRVCGSYCNHGHKCSGFGTPRKAGVRGVGGTDRQTRPASLEAELFDQLPVTLMCQNFPFSAWETVKEHEAANSLSAFWAAGAGRCSPGRGWKYHHGRFCTTALICPAASAPSNTAQQDRPFCRRPSV
ncbi:hypothetical protein KIL84_021700, partial [Mauremys mutica]